ncbi:membrane protein [Paenibacillus baekrokdamisoli]|uniref:Membrane protein n=1 Tax=Paenibacillus baekrokdamisoli TaxID=1712516 RepID=A0A3G9IYF8_9BACL|nr:DMT family transporter [Paenibacillus baekrokdamisoli]MBB3068725.1 transporter family-2 protein [Paenibacillus baekrokdamisoli]BBH23556.1 membrane protein [Paenibacillus baekrokdamisoli]
MAGILYSLLAGIAIAIQGIVNTRVSEKAGFWLTNTIVHGSGFIVSLLLFALLRDGSISGIQTMNKGYLLGGVFGVVIVFSVMKGIGQLGPSYSVAILLVSQLIFATVIDSFGLFGAQAVPFAWNKVIGILVMVAGIAVFKWN